MEPVVKKTGQEQDFGEYTRMESRYKKLEVPEFKSNIPAHMMAKLPEEDRYLVDMVSRMEQQSVWLQANTVDNNQDKIDMDVRLATIEKWKERLTSRWAVFAYVAAILVPVLINKAVEHFWK